MFILLQSVILMSVFFFDFLIFLFFPKSFFFFAWHTISEKKSRQLGATEAGEKLAFMTPEHLAEAAETASNEASRVLASGRGRQMVNKWGHWKHGFKWFQILF